jgi:hypothetical protein
MEEKHVFLIQQSGKKPAEHLATEFSDRTYADEAIKYGYYRNDMWDVKKRDQDFGKVKVGDYILAYYTGNVEESPNQIRCIYEVTEIEKIPDEEIDRAVGQGRISEDDADRLRKNPHVLRLKVHRKLKRGLELSLIRQWVDDGKLSKGMNYCGRLGFNICQVSYEDYKAIIEWDQKVVTPPPPLPSHNEIRDIISEIGKFEGWISEVEYPIDNMRLDVAWKRIRAGNPSHAFEVQIGGNFFEALTKLKHAWDKWNSTPFLVTTEKYETEAKQLLEGSFHEIEHVAKIVNWKKIKDLYEAEKKARDLKDEIGVI